MIKIHNKQLDYPLSGSYEGDFTGSLIGTASHAISSDTATTADTASYYAETDPVFTSVSGSFATTGSNLFFGNQSIDAGSVEGFGSGIKFINESYAHYSIGVSGSTFVVADTSAQYGNVWAAPNIKLQLGATDSLLTTNLGVTGSVSILGNQAIYGTNGYILLSPTNSEPNYTVQEIHTVDQGPWIARFFNDTFSTTQSVMSYFGWDDGRFVFHNDSTQSIGLQINGYNGENGLLVYPDKVAFVNNVEVTGSINSPSITGSLLGTASYAQTASYYAGSITSASYALTSSYVELANTASNILGGKATHIPFFITDTTLATSSLYQSGSGTVIINQDNATSANPEALYVWQPSDTSFNVISGKGNLNNYLQLNISNTNQGANASSDVVATANNGNENINYIDMGINSQNFSGYLGGPNDSYLYSTGNNMWIGNVTDNDYLYIFNSSSLNPIIILTPDSKFTTNANAEVTGSLKVTSGITGSLLGTASYSAASLSASYALTASYALNVPSTASYALRALTASYALNVPVTASYAISASYAINAGNADNATYATTAGNGGVTQLIAGSGISLIPAGGQGIVTIVSSGGGGTTIISGSNVTQSFSNSSTWTFTHNLGVRTPIIEVFDSNYNQMIPQTLQLTDTSSATITFPVAKSGFAIASLGGTTGTVLSSSYSLFSTYATTASYYTESDPVFASKSGSFVTTSSFNSFTSSYKQDSSSFSSNINSLTNATSSYVLNSQTSSMSVLSASYATTASYYKETDPIFTSKSASLATTGSNTFIGIQTVTGSLFTSGSNTLVGNTVLSGSVNISGSTIIVGTTNFSNSSTTITGSLLVSGSTTQIGNNTLVGNTVLSGSFEVSGSTVLHNSVFIVTGSTSIKGTTQISGSTSITGSLNVINGDINIVSGSSFTRWGNKLFNYGAFSSTITQSGSADTILSMSFNNTDVGGSGVSLVSGSRITVENTGVYNLQFSSQFNRTNTGTDTVTVWFAYTGSSIANSATDVVLTGNASANPLLASWNYILPMSASSYVQIYWSTPDAAVRMTAVGTRTGPVRPAVPSVIATLTQIA